MKVIIEREDQLKIVREAHEGIGEFEGSGHHSGKEKTMGKFSGIYFWNGYGYMSSNVLDCNIKQLTPFNSVLCLIRKIYLDTLHGLFMFKCTLNSTKN